MTAPKSRRQQQAERTREQLVTAARAVFSGEGYANATVGAIAKAAETAHGTFYLYFDNKEDAFRQVMAEVVDELYREAAAPWARDPVESIHEASRGFLLVFEKNAGLLKALMEAAMTEEALRALWVGLRQPFVDRIARNLRRAREAGTARDVDPELAARLLGGMVEFFAFTHFCLGEPAPDELDLDLAVSTITTLWSSAAFKTETLAPP